MEQTDKTLTREILESLGWEGGWYKDASPVELDASDVSVHYWIFDPSGKVQVHHTEEKDAWESAINLALFAGLKVCIVCEESLMSTGMLPSYCSHCRIVR